MHCLKSSALLSITALSLAVPSSIKAQATQHVNVQFSAVVGNAPFACGRTYDGVGLKKTSITPQDLRFFVSGVELLKDDGGAVKLTLDQDGVWQYHDLALLDFEDGTSSCRNGNAGLNSKVSGTVPEGSYSGVRFVLGVPAELDHLDAASAPAPLNTTAMFWSWQNGYKFLRLEVAAKVVAASEPEQTPPTARKRAGGFPMHLGSVGCVSTSPTTGPKEKCTQPNRVTVSFDHFDVSKDVVTADVAALFAKTDFTPDENKEGAGCMSFPGNSSCEGVMESLGLPYGEIKSSVQSFFRLEAATPSLASTPIATSAAAKVE